MHSIWEWKFKGRGAGRGLLILCQFDYPLISSYPISPPCLCSALGRYDGDVYKALLDMAQGSPLNATEEGPAWEQVLKPVMLASRSRM